VVVTVRIACIPPLLCHAKVRIGFRKSVGSNLAILFVRAIILSARIICAKIGEVSKEKGIHGDDLLGLHYISYVELEITT
jgi:hypothetical protein